MEGEPCLLYCCTISNNKVRYDADYNNTKVWTVSTDHFYALFYEKK